MSLFLGARGTSVSLFNFQTSILCISLSAIRRESLLSVSVYFLFGNNFHCLSLSPSISCSVRIPPCLSPSISCSIRIPPCLSPSISFSDRILLLLLLLLPLPRLFPARTESSLFVEFCPVIDRRFAWILFRVDAQVIHVIIFHPNVTFSGQGSL